MIATQAPTGARPSTAPSQRWQSQVNALQVRVDDEADDRDRPEPVHERVELVDGDQEHGERAEAEERRPAPSRADRPAAPAAAVRGLRASIPASISRFSPMASERAPTIATVIQSEVVRARDAVDGEERADVGEREREDRVLELDERVETRG